MYTIGVDIGGMSVKAGVVNADGNIIARSVIKTDAVGNTERFIRDIADLLYDVTSRAHLSPSDIRYVGMGVPGTVNSDAGIVTYACNIGFRNVNLRDAVSEYWHTPVYLGNDADVAALGEVLYGAGRGTRDALMITLGTGVGTGIIINSKIYSGRSGAGGESGHTVIVVGGEKCACGRRGCFEAYASATALMRMTSEAVDNHPSSILASYAREHGIDGRTAFEARKLDCPVAEKVVGDYVMYIGEGTANLVNIFRPEKVIIGGGVSNQGDYFMAMIEDYVNANAYGRDVNPSVAVVKATLGNDAGIIGAARLGE